MEYIGKIKYCLTQDEVFLTSVRPEVLVDTRFITMDLNGVMTVKIGWVWDGCSGPTIDSEWNHRAGCGHDALYWLIRNEYISEKWKPKIDSDFFTWLLDGIAIVVKRMKYFRDIRSRGLTLLAQAFYWGVKKVGGPATKSRNRRVKLTAP